MINIEHTYLTLEEIESIANKICENYNPKSTIRDKFRFLTEPLVCRYCYYTLARKQRHPDTRRCIHGVQEVARRIGFKHPTLVNGIGALKGLINSNNELAIRCFAEMNEACDKLLKQKKDDYLLG